MTVFPPARKATPWRNRVFWMASACVAVGIFAAANAHLVYVAFRSQPDCVAHTQSVDQDNKTYRAAKSGC